MTASANRTPLRALCLALALASVAGAAWRCPAPPAVRIVAPAPDGRVGGCETEVAVRLRAGVDPATLHAELNGSPLALERAAPRPPRGPLGWLLALLRLWLPHWFPPPASLWTATVLPGGDPGLAAHNQLAVEARDRTGVVRSDALTFSFDEAPASARRVASQDELPTGPQADGRVGDWLLENCRARFVVQDAPQRDLTGVAQYGGNLIDLERRGRPGLESFQEIQPALHVETVVHAISVELVHDGGDGEPAAVRACGPDDLLDYINPSTLVDELLEQNAYPPDADDADLPIEACTTYALATGVDYVEMATTVENLSSSPLGLYVGDYLNGSGELEQWTSEPLSVPNPPGLTSGLGEMDVNLGLGVFSYFGFGDAEGYDVHYVPERSPGAAFATTSFTTSGVSAVLLENSVISVLLFGSPPTFTVPANGARTFTRTVGVGDGSGANGVEREIEQRGVASAVLRGCVTVGGEPAPGARVAAGLLDDTPRIEALRSHWVADEEGCYEGRVPAPATYGVAASLRGAPYEGGGERPVYHEVALAEGDEARVDIALPPAGRVEVSVRDAHGRALPARVTIVGSDPSPEIVSRFAGLPGLTITTSTFRDVSRDPLPDGVVWMEYAGADGHAAFDLEPGTYQIWVSRGTEYSAWTAPLEVEPAPAPPARVEARIGRVLDTRGFVSSDFHVHQLKSSDSRIANRTRVLQFAGEGVDNLVATDHDRHTDLRPFIAAEGLEDFLFSTVGEEITTFDYGHFNAYPLGIDPDRISGGSTDWAGAAEPGRGFPDSSPPAYTLLPGEIFDAVHETRRRSGGLLNDSPAVAVQVNHIGSHFSPLKIDTADPPLRSRLSDAEKAERRFDPATPAGDFFHPFDALEVWNGYTRGQQSEFLDERIGIWMNLLNQGLPTTAIFDTDSHGFFNTRSAGARSWTPSSSDEPREIDVEEVGFAVKDGKVVGGQGLYVQARLVDPDDPARSAGFGLHDPTQLSVSGGEVLLEVRVQAPRWAEYDRIEIYRNATTRVAGANGGVPVLYTAEAAEALDLGTGFEREVVEVHPGLPGGSRYETHLERSYALDEDTWFVVVVRGTDEGTSSMFPVMAADVVRGGVHALGATNALYADADGDGIFDPPGVSVAP